MNVDRHLFAFLRNADGGGAAGAAGAAGAGAAGAGAAGGAAGAGAGGAAGAGAAGAGKDGGAGAGGNNNQPWYSSHNFDADTVAWIEERKFPDLAETLKAGREGSRLARDRNVIEKPDPKKLNEWKGWTDLGWTPEIDKYNVAKPEVKQGEHFDESEFAEFRRFAHDERIPPEAAARLYAKMNALGNKVVGAELAKQEAAEIAANNKLKTELGVDYEPKKELGRRAAQTVFKNMPVERIEQILGISDVLRGMIAVGEMLGEDKLIGGASGGPGVGGTETVAGLQAEFNRLIADPDFKRAFNDPRHPQHNDMVLKRQNLLERKAALELKARGGRAAA